VGGWVFGLGGVAQSPNPQSPIPNPQSPIPIKSFYINLNDIYLIPKDKKIKNKNK
jgi:hypothetical protein